MRRAHPLPVLRAPLRYALGCAALGALALGCAGDRPATANEVLDRALARYAEDWGGIEDFTVAGDSVVIYYRRIPSPDSLPSYELRAVTTDSLRRLLPVPPFQLPAVPALAEQLRDAARLEEETALVSGRPAYVLEATDPGLILGGPQRSGLPRFGLRAMFDTETFRLVTLHVETPHDTEDGDTTATVEQTFRYGDFQTTRGLTLPLRATTVNRVPVSRARHMMGMGQVGFMRQRAQQLPPDQRAPILAEADRMERQLQTGITESRFIVRAVSANTGVPAELFEPPPGMLAPPPAPAP